MASLLIFEILCPIDWCQPCTPELSSPHHRINMDQQTHIWEHQKLLTNILVNCWLPLYAGRDVVILAVKMRWWHKSLVNVFPTVFLLYLDVVVLEYGCPPQQWLLFTPTITQKQKKEVRPPWPGTFNYLNNTKHNTENTKQESERRVCGGTTTHSIKSFLLCMRWVIEEHKKEMVFWLKLQNGIGYLGEIEDHRGRTNWQSGATNR